MKIAVLLFGFALVAIGAAGGGVVLETLLHRRRLNREADLQRRMGLNPGPRY